MFQGSMFHSAYYLCRCFFCQVFCMYGTVFTTFPISKLFIYSIFYGINIICNTLEYIHVTGPTGVFRIMRRKLKHFPAERLHDNSVVFHNYLALVSRWYIYLLPILYSNSYSAGKTFKGCTNMKATSLLLIIGLSAILR